ncbi:hypothetical protein ACSVDA_11050 [Cytobacillus sp. Hm23]
MLMKIISLFTGFLCGYVFIRWIPIESPVTLSGILNNLIFDPLKFIAAMVCFFVGFICNAFLIRSAIEQTYLIFKKNKVSFLDIALSYGILPSFYLLFNMGYWQSLIYLSFAVIYGMISIDLKRNSVIELNR